MFMETITKVDSLTFFNYAVFIVAYFIPRMRKLNISKVQAVYYTVIFTSMFFYDLIDLRYLIRKTED